MEPAEMTLPVAAMQGKDTDQPLGWRRSTPLSQLASLLMPGMASAALLYASHFPFACGWLAWIALVPLLSLVRRDSCRRGRLFGSWLGGVFFFVPVLQWLRLADPRNYYSWPGLATYCSLYFPLAIGLIRFLDRRARWPLVLTVPVVWTALEYLRAHLLTGFPWYFLGHTQHDFLILIQVADLGGTYAVTFVVAAVNALIFEVLSRRRWWVRLFSLEEPSGASQRLRVQAVVVGVLLAGCLVYGVLRLHQADFTLGPRIALIQGNLEQRIRNAAAQGETANGEENPAVVMAQHFQHLHALASRQRPDLIVWPETSHPDGWLDRGYDVPGEGLPGFQQRWNRALYQLVRAADTNVLFGLNTEVLLPGDQRRLYNSAVLLRPGAQLAERYDKMHRVPFGEYVPLRDTLAFMNVFAPYDFDYSISAGEHLTRFALGPHYFGVVICYEDSDPTLARQYVREGDTQAPAVDFLINLSNDGWFQGSSEHEEHLAICRFRAVECRRAIGRAVNMGISAVIDGNGRVLRPLLAGEQGPVQRWEIAAGTAEALPVAEWHRFKKVAGVLTAVLPIDRRASLYAALGDWLPTGCWLVLGGGLVGTLVRRQGGIPARESAHRAGGSQRHP